MSNNKIPMILKWGLYFKDNAGYENRDAAAKEFAEFWSNRKIDKFKMSSKLMLGGKVYGREGFEDGEMIFTSSVIAVTRIGHSVCNDVPHDLMCATTVSGSKYLFYSDDYNIYTKALLHDIVNAGQLSPQPRHYLEPMLYDYGLI